MAVWSRANLMQLVQSLPDYRQQQRVAQDCEDCMKEFKSLTPKVDLLVRNDGTESTLVSLQGTLPMYYNTKQYNCPVKVWLNFDYPSSPPTCYVNPTADMAIKPRHVHVDSAGFIYHQYLTEWGSRCTLKQLCSTLSQVFSKDPPVYALPPGSGPKQPAAAQPSRKTPAPAQPRGQQPTPQPPAPQPQPPAEPPAQAQGQAQHLAPAANMAANQAPQRIAIEPSTASFPPAQPPPPPLQNQPEVRSQPDPRQMEENERLELVAMVSSKLQTQLETFMRTNEDEFNEYQTKARHMEDTVEALRDGSRALNEEREKLLLFMDQLDAADKTVNAYLKKRQEEPVPPAEDLVAASDSMATQLMECVAQDKAIEDALYHLDQALSDGSIEAAEYLRLTLKLSRQQFFEKELANKILARRRQLGVF
mmetsp:Transcript_24228/g.38070  ORF Transcript_24228/g.38070 Transcript_24228/m.38070 type:complete len:420 (+) Transcript_24228:35-1294(+)|eukprot:CAMPEP_0184302190 /NCGR_PEP_ID=MMETSP1049-20130417/12236_1 /TAXON_ID=77928 /ORGANISM="Proteomonas sulcata, Strain CCMP704" /LENGTH=419 /DNA_ID=CAMNT_0026613417 /DNA_START=33 /DNA_END=1292 /DNA_ORIENTATION=+